MKPAKSRKQIQEKEQKNSVISVYTGLVASFVTILTVIRDFCNYLFPDWGVYIGLGFTILTLMAMWFMKKGAEHLNKVHNKKNLRKWNDFCVITATSLFAIENIFINKVDKESEIIVIIVLIIFLLSILISFFVLVLFAKDRDWNID